jgi:hypothetical protein
MMSLVLNFLKKTKLIVKNNTANNQACEQCIKKGLENPDGRTKKEANYNSGGGGGGWRPPAAREDTQKYQKYCCCNWLLY